MTYKILYLLLGVTILALIASAHRANNLQRQIGKLDEQALASLADQERCAKRAEAFFNDYARRGHGDAATSYDSHYNPKLRKCFVNVTITGFAGRGNFSTFREIFSAFESKTYGTYVQDKADYEAPPLVCRVTKSDGTERECQSESEFDQMAAEYIGQ